ncbi:MAG: cryptochrome/photolyase family protein [Microthrixaceae bacterium]
MTSHSSSAVVWFRSDLRLDDNPAWAAATSRHDRVLALFVLDGRLMQSGGVHRRALFSAHLGALDSSLREFGGQLVVRSADESLPLAQAAAAAVVEAVADVGASEVHLNADVGRLAQQRDALVAQRLSEQHGVKVHPWWGRTVHRAGTVLTKQGTLSRVFTPFHKRWEATVLDDWPEPGDAEVLTAGELTGECVEPPEPEGSPCMAPGEGAAVARLAGWLASVDDYDETRNIPAMAGTSQLSADLRFGTIAARRIAEEVGTSTKGRAAYVRQLAWRDWYTHMMWEMPSMVDRAVRSEYDAIDWQDDPDEFAAWCAGRTGYPIVDAGMRQLVETGWMHNRLRMICASFLVKDLLVDWRKGERFFRHHLIDSDLAQNVGNWQWVAGTGLDAAPYFRVFNPTAQQQKWDPEGDFVSQWIDPADADYPEPIVEHAPARERALAAYKAALD